MVADVEAPGGPQRSAPTACGTRRGDRTMPAEFKETLILREVEDLSYREIADGNRRAARHRHVKTGASAPRCYARKWRSENELR